MIMMSMTRPCDIQVMNSFKPFRNQAEKISMRKKPKQSIMVLWLLPQNPTCIFRPISVYQFRSTPVQSVDDLQYRGKVNTFLKLSPFNSTLSDSRPIPSRQTTAIPHFPPHQESEIHFSTIKTVIL